MTYLPRYLFMGHATVDVAVTAGLEAQGYERADKPCDADVILTYLSSQSVLEDIYFDDGGLIQSAQHGTLLIDLSPATPSVVREIEAVATVNDLMFVEAPLVVLDATVPDAFGEYSNLACYLTGETDALDQARVVVSAFASSLREFNGAGIAQVARAVHTIQSVAHMLATIEADALVAAIRHVPAGMSAHVEQAVSAHGETAEATLAALATQRFSGTFTIEILMAELYAAIATADDAKLILPQAETALNLLELLASIGGLDMTPTALSLAYRDEAQGIEFGLDWSRIGETHEKQDDIVDDDLNNDDCSHLGYCEN